MLKTYHSEVEKELTEQYELNNLTTLEYSTKMEDYHKTKVNLRITTYLRTLKDPGEDPMDSSYIDMLDYLSISNKQIAIDAQIILDKYEKRIKILDNFEYILQCVEFCESSESLESSEPLEPPKKKQRNK